MDNRIAAFFQVLHEQHLKPRGYKKSGRNFHRIADGYTERVQFQGSAWNGSSVPWRFYVNVGVEFQKLRMRTARKGFPGTHCWARIGGIVVTAPEHFDLQPNRAQQLARRLAKLLEAASRVIGRKQSHWRASFRKTRNPYIEML